tara:strand:+ start:1416 stop:2060 length:645 start_codon:yes stop_codon:yes gene_type:complete
MSMTFTEIKTNIADVTENTFTDDQLKLFVTLAEENILNSIQIPALRKTDTTSTLTSGTATLSLPSDYLYTYSLAIKSATNVVTYLVVKDNSFLLEAYPDQDTTGIPKYYAQYEQDKLVVVPTPNSSFSLIHTYGHYPTSITASGDGTSWLGENVPAVLLNASLVEAARFMKAEPDVVAMYKEQYIMSLKLTKMLGDGKLRGDVYRNGQPIAEVM